MVVFSMCIYFFLISLLFFMGNGFSSVDQTERKSDFLGFYPISFWESMEWKRSSSGSDFQEDKDVKIAEQNFSLFCQRGRMMEPINYELAPSKFSIPPILHFIWIGSPVTPQVEKAIASWKKHHPGWKIKLWTDEKVETFTWTEDRLYKLFKEASTWAEKADIWRLDILYQFGGIYSDVDVICLRPFHDLIVQDITFFSCFELNYTSSHYGAPFFVGTAVMGSSKNSEVMKYGLDHCKSQSEAPLENLLKRTGPGLVSRACQAHFSNPKENILILPCSYLYPFPWKMRDENSEMFIAPESLSIHVWNYSWKPS